MEATADYGTSLTERSESEQANVQAAYGKACINCVKSKTRCASSTSENKCERCQRLNKDCQPAHAVRKRRVSKRPQSSTSIKTAALEEKLDGIVQMLQRSQASASSTIINHPPESAQIQSQDFDSRTFATRTITSKKACKACENRPAPSNSNLICQNFFNASCLSSSSIDELEEIRRNNRQGSDLRPRILNGQEGQIQFQGDGPLTPAASTTEPTSASGRHSLGLGEEYPLESKEELEECLQTYRAGMVQYFPIVCISPEVTVEELRTDRPFLFLVIRAICSKDITRQNVLFLQVKTLLGREMLLEGSRNLDLFLGVLVFAAWCHYYICQKPIVTTVVQLGASLAFDLGLTRPLPVENTHIMLHHIASGCPRPPFSAATVRTLEERRAVVGLFLVNSTSANYFQRLEHMRWTPYLEECLQILGETKEYTTDQLLVYLTRAQLICDRASASTWNEMCCDGGSKIPQDFYIKTLKYQLDDLERSIPQGLKSNETLRLQILSTTLSIHEHSLNTSPKLSASDPGTQLQRSENLWICLSSIKSWFNLFYDLDSFPLVSFSHISTATIAQLAHCLVALFRLSSFESPDLHWDRRRVREEVDLCEVIKLLAERWEQVPRAAGIKVPVLSVCGKDNGIEEWAGDTWSHVRKRVLGIKNWWEAKVAVMDAADAEKERGAMAEESNSVNGFPLEGQQQMEALEFGAMNMDMMDDTWMRDLLGGGYEFNPEPYF